MIIAPDVLFSKEKKENPLRLVPGEVKQIGRGEPKENRHRDYYTKPLIIRQAENKKPSPKGG
jgi:hypothetical protein